MSDNGAAGGEAPASRRGAGSAARDDVAARIAQRTLASRAPDYASEVRRLLDAGREVMRCGGAGARPRVADIVAAAGLSNDAFYRHFPSKDALVSAILDDGTAQLRSYLEHQMAKAATVEEKVGAWVAGVLTQAADPDVAATTRAVLWNAGGVADVQAAGLPEAELAPLLEEPLAALGSPDPGLAASFIAHAVVGKLADLLRSEVAATPAELEQLIQLCLAVARQAAAG